MKNKNTWGIIVLAAIVLLLIGFLAGNVAIKSTNTVEQVTPSDKMLVVIEDHSLSNYYIVYDKDTKIIYYQGFGSGACLHPLYNPDGTFKLYGGN